MVADKIKAARESEAPSSLAEVASRASTKAAVGKDGKDGTDGSAVADAVVTIEKSELEGCDVRGLKWSSFIEARNPRGALIWLIPAPDPNEFHNGRLRYLLEMGVTKLEKADWDKTGLDRAKLSYDSWIEVDLERNFIKQRAYFKPTPKLPEPEPLFASSAKKLAQGKTPKPPKARGRAGVVPSSTGRKGSGAGRPGPSALTQPGGARQPSHELETTADDDDEVYWRTKQLEWRQQQTYLEHREWRTRDAAQQQHGWKPPRSPSPAPTRGSAPPPPAAVAAGAAFLANWQQQVDEVGGHRRPRGAHPHPSISRFPPDDELEGSDSRSPRHINSNTPKNM